MIPGYNTDVEHDGVVYHVQTEDKGLESRLILSLVYSGGEILASKRSPYEDLVAAGYNDEVLAERLKRQHRLICAAIHAGRIEDLKRMGQSEAAAPVEAVASQEVSEPPLVDSPPAAPPIPSSPVPPPPSTSHADAYTVHDQRRQSPLGEVPTSTRGLQITLLDDREYRSGESMDLRILVSFYENAEERPVSGATVSVKVLGTAFRPQIYSVKTEGDGIASVAAQVPEFTTGRAALLIKATASGNETELRRVIHAI